jgi:membrane fusion protein, multidrug efflux system
MAERAILVARSDRSASNGGNSVSLTKLRARPAILLAWFLLAALNIVAAMAQTPPPAVLVATAEMRDITPATEFVGRVKATDRVDIRARVTGFLGLRLFKDGDLVTEGQVLFKLDSAPFEAIVQQKQAAVQSAEASLQLADLQAQRSRDLVRTNAAPQSQVDQREADLTRAKADLALAQASLREASINLSYTQIQSPISGRVGDAIVTPGNLVDPGTGVLAVVVKQDPIDVIFPVTQRQLIEIRRQNSDIDLDTVVVSLKLVDGSRYDQTGRINYIGIQADPRTDSVPLRAVFPNPQGILDDGMSVRVVLEAAKPEQALVIPQAAILQDQAGSYVFTVAADNKATEQRIKAEIQRDGSAVIRDGLKAGERVIVQGQGRVRAGMVVAPSPMPQGS